MENKRKPDRRFSDSGSSLPPKKRKGNRISVEKSGMKPGAILQFLEKKLKAEDTENNAHSDAPNSNEPMPEPPPVCNDSESSDDDCVVIGVVCANDKIPIILLSDNESNSDVGNENALSQGEASTTLSSIEITSLPDAAPECPVESPAILQENKPNILLQRKSPGKDSSSVVASVESDEEFFEAGDNSVPSSESNNESPPTVHSVDEDECLYENAESFEMESAARVSESVPSDESNMLSSQTLNETRISPLPANVTNEILNPNNENDTVGTSNPIRIMSVAEVNRRSLRETGTFLDDTINGRTRDLPQFHHTTNRASVPEHSPSVTSTVVEMDECTLPSGEDSSKNGYESNDTIRAQNNILIQVIQRSLTHHEDNSNHGPELDDNNDSTRDIHLECSPVFDDISRIQSTPLKTTTENAIHRLGPQKKKEKAIYTIQTESTPSAAVLRNEDDENLENTENSIASIGIENTCSIANTVKPKPLSFASAEEGSARSRSTYLPKTKKVPTAAGSESPTSKLSEEIKQIDYFISRKSFGKAAELLLNFLEKSEYEALENHLKPQHISTLTKCILDGKRVPKDVNRTVVEIWDKLMIKFPMSKGTKSYYSSVLLQICFTEEEESDLSRDAPDGYSDLLILLLKAVKEECQLNPKDKPILKLTQIITCVVMQEYEDVYLVQDVKIRPIILEIVNNNNGVYGYNEQIRYLLKNLFELHDFAEPFYEILKLIARLADHFDTHRPFKDKITLTADICDYLRKPECTAWEAIIRQMSRRFGTCVCEHLLKDMVYSTPHFPSQEINKADQKQDEEAFKTFMEKFSPELKACIDSEETFVNMPKDSFAEKQKNLKGETLLHLLVNREQSLELTAYLEKIRKYKLPFTNERDHGNNTPLHDAADNAVFAHIMRFSEHNLNVHGDPDIPDYIAANLLAKDNQGNTPLHLLAAKNASNIIEPSYWFMQKEKTMKNILLLTRNNNGQRPLDVATDAATRHLLEPTLPYADILHPSSRAEIASNGRFLGLAKLWYLFTTDRNV